METNIKVVVFANQSINGMNVNNQGFDLDYDGSMLNVSGFSGDKLYYGRLNNNQLMNLLQMRPSHLPLDQRIMHYKNKPNSNINHEKNIKQIRFSPRTYKHKTHIYKRSRTPTPYIVSSYKSPRLRSEYKPRTSSHKRKSLKRQSSKHSNHKTIY
jgi:hypothetical protein